jgi:hypothetical protein
MKSTQRILTAALAIAASFLFTACGAGGASTPMTSKASPFTNQTSMQDAAFQTLAAATWSQAQTKTSTQWTDLWAAYRVLQNEPADPDCYTGVIICEGFIPPTPAAASLAAQGVVVTAVADTLAGPDTPNHPSNPTGIIPCPGGTGYCNAYVVFNSCTISVPTSIPANMGPYEMQNCLLNQLGFDISRR